jgi:DNA invertase Pin-like site-specific DNA recombinase
VEAKQPDNRPSAARHRPISTTDKDVSRTRRPQLDAALDYARGGDVLVVWRLDRLGRSLRHLVDLVEDLVAREIGLRSLAEGIDTATPVGRMTLHVFGALAEFECQLVAERSQPGAAAKARGARLGRRPVMTPARRDTAREMHAYGRYTAGEIAATLGVSHATLYRHLPSPTVGARAGPLVSCPRCSARLGTAAGKWWWHPWSAAREPHLAGACSCWVGVPVSSTHCPFGVMVNRQCSTLGRPACCHRW